MRLQRQATTSKWLAIPLLLAPLFLLAGCPEATYSMGTQYNNNGTWNVHGGVSVTVKASDLSSFSAADAVANYAIQNTSFYSRTGDMTITVSDATTGGVLGTNNFGYTINSGNQLVLSDPTGATQWVQSFEGYSGNVVVAANLPVEVTNPPSGSSGSVGATAVYAGQTEGSASATVLDIGGDCGGTSAVGAVPEFCKLP
jgi:hypothetical protein